MARTAKARFDVAYVLTLQDGSTYVAEQPTLIGAFEAASYLEKHGVFISYSTVLGFTKPVEYGLSEVPSLSYNDKEALQDKAIAEAHLRIQRTDTPHRFPNGYYRWPKKSKT